MKKNTSILVIALMLLSLKPFAQITLVPFATGFSEAVDIVNAGDDRLFVVERAGRIRIVDTTGAVKPGYFLDIHLEVESGYNEQGLLGLAFDPDYATTGYFYCYYTQKNTDSLRIVRFSVSATNPDSADASSEFEIIGINHNYAQNHDGGDLFFRPTDGYLYIGTGDGGSGGDPLNRAQNLDTLLGKIIRLDVSSGGNPYSIPPANPLVGLPGRDEIYNVGMRNPWRWSFDRWNGDMWIGDVGQNLYEEIDYQPASSIGGENYGWRCYEGNHTYNTAGCASMSNYVFPVREYSHSAGGVATIGGYRYRGANFSNMFGKYFYSDENTSGYGVHYLLPNGTGGWTDASLGALGRSTLVCFGEDRWGELYVSEYANSTIYKFQGTSCSPVAYISDEDTMYVCDTLAPQVLRTPEGNGFHYEWFVDGNSIPASDNDSLIITQGGVYHVTVTTPATCTATSNSVTVIYAGPPTISFAGLDTFYCVYSAQAHLIPSPIGGDFSGPGMTGIGNSYFDPSIAGAGDFTITYAYTSPVTGCSNSVSSQVHVDLCSGIATENFLPRFNLFPNPNSGTFILDFYQNTSMALNAEVMDATGRIVYTEQLHTEAGAQSVTMKLSHLANGIYNLKVSGDQGVATKHFVIE